MCCSAGRPRSARCCSTRSSSLCGNRARPIARSAFARGAPSWSDAARSPESLLSAPGRRQWYRDAFGHARVKRPVPQFGLARLRRHRTRSRSGVACRVEELIVAGSLHAACAVGHTHASLATIAFALAHGSCSSTLVLVTGVVSVPSRPPAVLPSTAAWTITDRGARGGLIARNCS